MKRDTAFLSYLALRATAAAGALLAGVCQTYTFARVLDAHRFSLFIVIGNLGLSLWLFDLGIAKVLYVNLRAHFLGGRLADERMGVQAMAVVAAYGALVVLGGIGIGLMWASGRSGGGWVEAVDFALFFIYSALNLVWFALRNISSATDQYLFFEGLEAARRVGHLALMFCLLAALPFTLFLLASNAVWIVLLVMICARLRRRGGLAGRLGEAPAALVAFFRGNRSALLGSGGYAAGEMVIYNFPSVLVPAVHGLGAPTIIFDTVFKIFRGATVLFSAACDLLVPRQTQAYAQRDHRQVRRATAFAFALAAVPALALCVLLLVAGDRVYALLLGGRVTVPSSFTPLVVGQIVCKLFQTVSNYVLVHTGF
ncbi:MAG: hypothetical protein P4L99_05600, partial [Chthoniobacter sp.]|nr:hypothetical protein [Chthoniobacter sp.]